MTSTSSPETTEHLPDQPWAMPADTVADRLDVSPDQGLSPDEARRRRGEYGPNRLRGREGRSAWKILVDQFKSVIIGIMAGAAIVALAFGQPVEALALGIVVVINAAIGFTTEYRAVRSMEALRNLGRVETTVRRGGELRQLPAGEVVPGDILVLEGGDVVTADARLIEVARLEVDEASLTGESLPVTKQVDPVDPESVLAERASMVFKGTAITNGSGEAVVVGTGMATELGHISELVESAEGETTPLQLRLAALGRRLLWLVLAVTVVVGVAGILAGREVRLIVETAIALAIAAVPEGLPIVATVALARGMRRMASRNALIERLEAVETLGSVGVILTDKTGTLTENEMVLARLALTTGDVEISGGHGVEGNLERDGSELDADGDPVLRHALLVSALCNSAEVAEDLKASVGDPMEIAMILAAAKAGMDAADLQGELPEVREEGFDPDVKMMATYHRQDGDILVLVKGAPAAVLESCTAMAGSDGHEHFDDEGRDAWLESNDRLAAEGLRVLGLAYKVVQDEEVDPYEDLVLLGFAGLVDPPREDVRPSLEAAQNAGVRVVMVTGDQAPTARYVGEKVGLDVETVVHGKDLVSPDEGISDEERHRLTEASVFARTSPEQKLDIIGLHQEAGNIVAMIGDGVNDAPALENADIGVAMGRRGTQVAKESADMVLQDDEFGTIVVAIQYGRVIFHNIRAFVLYLLSCNLSQILSVGIAAVLALPLPILPLQILYLNFVTDVFPALALGTGEGTGRLMDRKPRPPDEPVMTRSHWALLVFYGALMTAAVLVTLVWGWEMAGLERERLVTITFMTLGFAQLWNVLNMAGPNEGLFVNEVTRNRWIWGAIVLCTGLLIAPIYIPGVQDIFRVVPLEPGDWAVVFAASFAPVLAAQVLRVPFLRKRVAI